MRRRLFLLTALLACSACTIGIVHRQSRAIVSTGALLVGSAPSSSLASSMSALQLPVVLILQRNAQSIMSVGIGVSLTSGGRIVTSVPIDTTHPLFIGRSADTVAGYVCDSLAHVVAQDDVRHITLLQTIAPVSADCSQGNFEGDWKPLLSSPVSSADSASGAVVHLVTSIHGNDIHFLDGRMHKAADQSLSFVPLQPVIQALPAGILFTDAWQLMGLTQAVNSSGSITSLRLIRLSPASESALPSVQ